MRRAPLNDSQKFTIFTNKFIHLILLKKKKLIWLNISVVIECIKCTFRLDDAPPHIGLRMVEKQGKTSFLRVIG